MPRDVAPPSTGKIPDSVCSKCSINTLEKASELRRPGLSPQRLSLVQGFLDLHLPLRLGGIHRQHKRIRSDFGKKSQTALEKRRQDHGVPLGKVGLRLVCTLLEPPSVPPSLLSSWPAPLLHPWRASHHLAEHHHPPNSPAPAQGLHPASLGKISNSKIKTL